MLWRNGDDFRGAINEVLPVCRWNVRVILDAHDLSLESARNRSYTAALSVRTLAIVSFLMLATILGRFQDFSPPIWAWIVWGILLITAIVAWFIVTRSVSFVIRKAIMLMPLEKRFEVPQKGATSLPVADLEKCIVFIEDRIRASLRFRPLQWLTVRAFRSQKEFFLSGILDYCKEQGTDVVNSRLIATYIKSTAAGKLGEFAGDIVSGGCQIAVIILVAVGLAFGMPR